jgi:hypothetical protein
MGTQKSRFHWILFSLLAALYLISITAFSYANWAADPEFMAWWKTLLNILILSIPLGLLYGSIYVLAMAWRAHRSQKQISPRLAKVVHWAPRAAAILIIFFVSLFSLDVLGMETTPLKILGGFLVHNIPSIGMILLLIFSWKRPMVGFVAFVAAALLFALFFVRGLFALPNLLLFVLPLLVVAILFYAEGRWLTLQPPT